MRRLDCAVKLARWGLGRHGAYRGAVKWTAAFLAWTLLVWGGRIRNAVADPALDAGGRTGPLLLSLSFVLPALVLAVVLVLQWRGGPAARTVPAVTALAGWTTAVWVLRAGDIALGGDHEVGFVVVHVVLAVVSITLGWLAVRSLRRSAGRPADRPPVPS